MRRCLFLWFLARLVACLYARQTTQYGPIPHVSSFIFTSFRLITPRPVHAAKGGSGSIGRPSLWWWVICMCVCARWGGGLRTYYTCVLVYPGMYLYICTSVSGRHSGCPDNVPCSEAVADSPSSSILLGRDSSRKLDGSRHGIFRGMGSGHTRSLNVVGNIVVNCSY